MLVLFAVLVIMCNTKVNAAVTYTRTIPNNDGSITINLKGVALDTKKAYSYALVIRGGNPETWHTMNEYTATTAKINLSSGIKDILNVLKLADTGILYVKDDATGNYVVDGLEVNLKLPYIKATNIKVENNGNNGGNTNGGSNNENTNGSGNGGTNNNKDTTIAGGNLPKTGVSMTIVISIIAVLGCGVLGYVKYNSYRDIK